MAIEMSILAGAPKEKTVGAENILKQKTIEDIIAKLSSEVFEAEQTEARLEGLEERLQGPRPQPEQEPMADPSDDYVTLLHYHIGRLMRINRSMDNLLTNIESII